MLVELATTATLQETVPSYVMFAMCQPWVLFETVFCFCPPNGNSIGMSVGIFCNLILFVV